jgi:Cytochrome b involved in lipid metabolism
VRCWDATKNRQPPDFEWNVLGMMNNSWYTVKTDLITEQRGDGVAIMFRHPTEAASLSGGWMQPSQELLLAQTKQEGGIPEKQFTREEIEKHDKPDACWMVINNKVYDVTSVLEWHPGGKASIMTHAGKCHYETTEQFESIHDEFAHHKLRGVCICRRDSRTMLTRNRMPARFCNRKDSEVHPANC